VNVYLKKITDYVMRMYTREVKVLHNHLLGARADQPIRNNISSLPCQSTSTKMVSLGRPALLFMPEMVIRRLGYQISQLRRLLVGDLLERFSWLKGSSQRKYLL
jgi:hypothetical protein